MGMIDMKRHVIIPLGGMMWSNSPCPTYIEIPGNSKYRFEVWDGIYTMLELLSKESGKDLRSYRSVVKMFEKVYQKQERGAKF